MPVNYTVYKSYFQACEDSEKTPSLEDFISKHYAYIKSTFKNSAESLTTVWSKFKRAASFYGVEVKKGKASMAWKKFVRLLREQLFLQLLICLLK